MTVPFSKLPSLQVLQAAGKRPRVHGNGFIQLDIDEDHRLHVWGDPRIPRQAVASPIHDHVFDFVSQCYRGRIISIPYDVRYGEHGKFDVYECVMAQGRDTKLRRLGDNYRCSTLPGTAVSCMPGERYTFERGRFHESVAPEVTVTIMFKLGPTLADQPDMEVRPRVLVPYGSQPDNEFDRHAYEEQLLWQIIAEAVA